LSRFNVPVPIRPVSPPSADELPPLGEADDDAEGIADGPDALTPLEELEPEFDDERPTDPSFDFDLPSELDAAEADRLHELPLGPAFAPSEEETKTPDGDDTLGFGDAFEHLRDTLERDERDEHDALEGIDDDHARLDEGDLPALDADEPGLDEPNFGARLERADEAELAHVEPAWRVEFVAPEREHCSALAIERGVVVAGSSDLFWRDPGRATLVRMGLDGTRIASLALVGGDAQTALSVTSFGRLLRRSRSGGDVERLVEWRRVAEASGSSAEGLELRGLGPSRPSSVLGRLTSGRLVRSDDMGSTFHMLDASVTALSMSVAGDPVAVITRDGEHLGLSDDGGTSFQRRALASPAREVASGEAPLVAASGNVVVLGDMERGVAVSADGGRSFRGVAGVTNVTAVAAGTTGAQPTVFAAVYRETEDGSLLVEIDVLTGSARVIARLAVSPPADPDTAPELGRVERLLWDGDRLWAVGGFGLALVEPPH
jgi:hypothetical protein